MPFQAKPKSYVSSFKDGDGKNKKLLGGKGANLCEMTQIGINVPSGFVISTEASLEYLDKGGLDSKNQDLPPELMNTMDLLKRKADAKKLPKPFAPGGRELEAEHGIKLKFKFSFIIEVVRACMRAGRLAEIAEFFSFGTNDLTQSCFSFSRETAY